MALTLPTPKSGKLSSAVALSGTVALNVSVFDTSLHDTLAAMPIGVSSSIAAAVRPVPEPRHCSSVRGPDKHTLPA